MLEDQKRFDMQKKPMRQHLRPLLWALSFPALWARGETIQRVNMENIRPPYLLLCNHNAFMDMKTALCATFPHRQNFVVAIDGFIGREWLLRLIGCICKRKFTNDPALIWKMRRVIRRGDIMTIYPEARYSLCGTTAVLPEGIGRLAKFLKVPVVTLICHGHHVNSPFWNLPDHKVKHTEAVMTGLLTAEEVKTLPHEVLQTRIEEAFYYDDFRWQKENGVIIDFPRRADGLHKVLYQCPHCHTEYRMRGKGETLECLACHKTWRMTETGELQAIKGKTEFSHIPDWYEWERSMVRKEVENGTYGIELSAQVDALPNARRFIDIGKAVLRHDLSGFTLTGSENGKPYTVHLPAETLYSVHIEYDYLGKKGDCVDLNTLTDTLYTYPEGTDFSVTKMALATEEIFAYHKKNQN